jgi:hypothetical protein
MIQTLMRLDARVFGLAWRPSHQHSKKPELIAPHENLSVGERPCGRVSMIIKIIKLGGKSQ